jgi:hypothetical protein
MGDPVHSKVQQNKINYVKEQIAQLGDDYFPESTNLSLILFNSSHSSESFPASSQSPFESLKRTVVSTVSADGGTNFSGPLECARQIILDDHIRFSNEDFKRCGAPRSLIVFLSDGEDALSTPEDIPALTFTQLRDLNATSFILGIGQGYRMPRIVGLAGHAGASTWSHLPMDTAELDPFRVQLPAMIEQVLHCEHYLQFRAQGDYAHFSCVTPAIRFASNYSPESVFPGYLREAAGLLYEKRDNLALNLVAGRFCQDPDAEIIPIPIVDVTDAAHLFEKAQQADEFSKAARSLQAEDFHKRMVVLTALMTEDIDLLRALAEIDPSLQDTLQRLENGVRTFKLNPSQGTHDYYSSMTETGNTSVYFGSVDNWRKQQAHLDTKLAQSNTRMGTSKDGTKNTPTDQQNSVKPSVRDVLNQLFQRDQKQQKQSKTDPNQTQPISGLFSGNIGPLDNSASGIIPNELPKNLDPRKYDNVSPQQSFDFELETESGRRLRLTELARGQRYILGRRESHDDGIPIVIRSDTVSRRHAAIFVIGNEIHITDLNSRAGTYVGSIRVPTTSSILLRDGDVITLTNKRLVVKKR